MQIQNKHLILGFFPCFFPKFVDSWGNSFAAPFESGFSSSLSISINSGRLLWYPECLAVERHHLMKDPAELVKHFQVLFTHTRVVEAGQPSLQQTDSHWRQAFEAQWRCSQYLPGGAVWTLPTKDAILGA